MSKRNRLDNSPIEVDVEGLALCFGNDCFPDGMLLSAQLEQTLRGKQIVQTSLVTVAPPLGFVWDYHAHIALNNPDSTLHRGVCLKSELEPTGSIKFSSQDILWEYERIYVNKICFFSTNPLEVAYWTNMLIGIVEGVDIPGLRLNRELRHFIYAVPLSGLSLNGQAVSFFNTDSGVASGDYDNLFGPLLANSELTKDEQVWQDENPKTWGIVLAHDHIEAERIALSRAQLSVDVMNFALRTGVSHFKTRYDEEFLKWNAETGRSLISLHPWVCLLEAETKKGWVRSIPLIEQKTETNLEEVYGKIQLFIEKFKSLSYAGDLEDQSGQREISDREKKLFLGIQRALRWLNVAYSEISIEDQFLATWISLESLLNSLEYPGVFEGKRREYLSAIKHALDEMSLPRNCDESLSISDELIRNRVLLGEWPLRTKLVLFARSFGVQITTDDSKVVRDLQLLRSKILHGGQSDRIGQNGQLRRLQYLVERLIIAASICGYEDLEERSSEQFRKGKIGPEGGALPLYIDNKQVPYTLRIRVDEEGQEELEFTVNGKIYHVSKISDIQSIEDQ